MRRPYAQRQGNLSQSRPSFAPCDYSDSELEHLRATRDGKTVLMVNMPASVQRHLISFLKPDGEHASLCAHTAQLGTGGVGTQPRKQLVPEDGV